MAPGWSDLLNRSSIRFSSFVHHVVAGRAVGVREIFFLSIAAIIVRALGLVSSSPASECCGISNKCRQYAPYGRRTRLQRARCCRRYRASISCLVALLLFSESTGAESKLSSCSVLDRQRNEEISAAFKMKLHPEADLISVSLPKACSTDELTDVSILIVRNERTLTDISPKLHPEGDEYKFRFEAESNGDRVEAIVLAKYGVKECSCAGIARISYERPAQ